MMSDNTSQTPRAGRSFSGALGRFARRAMAAAGDFDPYGEWKLLGKTMGCFAGAGVLAVAGGLATAKMVDSDAFWNASKDISQAATILIETHQQYLAGVHSGMLAVGTEMSDETNERAMRFFTTKPVNGKHLTAEENALMEMRTLGAMAGANGFTEADLVSYLDYVEGLSDELTSARTSQAAAFNDLPGISEGDRLAKLAQAVGILGEDIMVDGSVDEMLDVLVKWSFDEGYIPTDAEMAQLKQVMTDAIDEVGQVASADEVVMAAKQPLVDQNLAAFAGKLLAMEDVDVDCPFSSAPEAGADTPQVLSSEDSCRPGMS